MCFQCMQGYLNEPMMKQNEVHGGLEQKLAYGQRDKIRIPGWEISPDFDGIIHSHKKKAKMMMHIPFPITLMGSECASSEGTRSKGKAQMITLPDHIDGKRMCIISGHESKHSDISLSRQLRFVCSWVRLDTYTLPEHNPQNHLQNCSAIVEVS